MALQLETHNLSKNKKLCETKLFFNIQSNVIVSAVYPSRTYWSRWPSSGWRRGWHERSLCRCAAICR